MISIIVLNWNGKKVLKGCLDSIRAQKFKNSEVIVVDNASTDGSQEMIKKKYAFVKLIKNKENRGYAGGNNIGIKKAKGEYILILNNDTVLDKNFLKELWSNRKKADILGVKNFYFDKKNIIWAIGSKVNKFTNRAKLVANNIPDSKKINKIKVEYLVGSAMLINKKVINKVGFLDESFFAYYEETEWQTRAKNKGFTISWIPSAKLWHKVAYSTGGGRSPLSAYYLVRNRGYYIKKWSKYKFIAYPFWIFEITTRIIYGLIKNRKYAKASLRGMIDFFNGVKGKGNF
jgi:GT2 family glycosyltransferase